MIRCIFGTLRTSGAIIDGKSFMCITPKVQKPGEVVVKITLNLQEFVETSQPFMYYVEPRIDTITPPLGPKGQITYLKIVGDHFIKSDYLRIRFGGTTRQYTNTVQAAAQGVIDSGSNEIVDPENMEYPVRKAYWVSKQEIHVETPVLS
jgi:hypothetical protein